MLKKYAGVQDLLSQLQSQWSEAPEEAGGEDEEFNIPQDMFDQLVWEEPASQPEQPTSLPSFISQPKPVPVQPAVQSLPSFITQPVQPKPEDDDVIPSWLPEGWQKDIPSFLGQSKYQKLDLPSFVQRDFPIPKRVPINTVDDAHSLFIALSNKDKAFFHAIDYVQEALEQIHIKGSVKVLADTLGAAIGQLKMLSTQDPSARKAIEILINYFTSETSKLPDVYQERVNKNILSQTDKKERPPQILTSRFLDPGVMFVRQKTLNIMKDQGLDKEAAQAAAKEEWAKVESFVNSINADNEVKSIARSTFAQHLLDGEGWEKAAEIAQRAAAAGADTSGVREKVRQASFDNDDLDDIIEDIANHEIVQSQLDTANVNNPELLNKIIEFGNVSRELNDIVDDQESLLEIDPEDIEKVQSLSNKLTSLSSDVMASDSNQIQSILKEYDQESVLEMVWWVYKVILNKAKDKFGSEGFVENPNISGTELAAAGLGIEDKRRKEKNPDVPGKKRIVDRRKQKEHEKNYTERGGEALLQSKKDYHEKRKQNPEEEKDYKDRQFIRKKDYRLTQSELKAWEKLAYDPVRVQSTIKEIQKLNAQRTLDFYDRINEVWNYPDDIDKIKEVEANLIRNRTYRYQDLLDKLLEDPKADRTVLAELRKNISDVPKYFEQARKIRLNENKVAEIIYFVNSLMKFAQAS